ncbi:hypothetical protein A2803_01260 [Candidatus Woesebacteria bacterium RIFCSPHIGHO2_01_FULL_44_21]|uniref:YCII-related domain-containing protein n=1 Tax=Candidatus Woesebacteria bacterium RIFCSPHIGHO2_01_FULL_44_21 TaxID=1802503 RepID=A0A1F7YZM3_9BACT|nr:MAG: hypothetical protein A2803_01260 [Candidatus Woesebacteria bacterium RIFCSPHIGHO2_01_FULL_44_21]OGM70820.1 MAG: hypothetical protein A2897_05250 [Candidatus Woesebacteria bacterium RIFCSPLOWO2_01_FULL_44_24b]
MKKFIVIYHAPASAAQKMANVSPEDAKKGMEPWFAWKEKVGSGMVDMGTPLGNGMVVTKDGTHASENEVVGYTILQANSMDEAVEMLKGHPHLDWVDGCSIEVHESLPLPGME